MNAVFLKQQTRLVIFGVWLDCNTVASTSTLNTIKIMIIYANTVYNGSDSKVLKRFL